MKSLEQQFKEIANRLSKNIENAMMEEVANRVIEEGRENVVTDVYEKYEPLQYKRKGDDGGLLGSWEASKIQNGIVVENTRCDERTGKYIPTVIETGEGYSYSGKEVYQEGGAWKVSEGREYEKPRPFIQNTREDIKNKDLFRTSLKKGLERQGIKVKMDKKK